LVIAGKIVDNGLRQSVIIFLHLNAHKFTRCSDFDVDNTVDH